MRLLGRRYRLRPVRTTLFVLHESACAGDHHPGRHHPGLVRTERLRHAGCLPATALALGLPRSAIAAPNLGIVTELIGRIERVERGQPFLVAHSTSPARPQSALERAIGAARQMLGVEGDGRILTVFGSAGKRDVEKRRLMAEIAARNADLTVLTAEDPRTESLELR